MFCQQYEEVNLQLSANSIQFLLNCHRPIQADSVSCDVVWYIGFVVMYVWSAVGNIF